MCKVPNEYKCGSNEIFLSGALYKTVPAPCSLHVQTDADTCIALLYSLWPPPHQCMCKCYACNMLMYICVTQCVHMKRLCMRMAMYCTRNCDCNVIRGLGTLPPVNTCTIVTSQRKVNVMTQALGLSHFVNYLHNDVFMAAIAHLDHMQ